MKKIVSYDFLKEQINLDQDYKFNEDNDRNIHYLAKTKIKITHIPTNQIYDTCWDKWRIGRRPHKTNIKLTDNEVRLRINSDPNFVVVEPFQYINAFTKFKVKNVNTDEEFEVTLNNWNKGKRPATSDSYVEDFIKDLLLKNNVVFSTQQEFDNLLSKRGHKLKFDFYIPSKNLFIEYNGPYHYKPIRGEENLQIQQENDKIKQNFCKQNNFKLHIIESSKWNGYNCNYDELEKEILDII